VLAPFFLFWCGGEEWGRYLANILTTFSVRDEGNGNKRIEVRPIRLAQLRRVVFGFDFVLLKA